MKTIFVINDGSSAAVHAAKTALMIAVSAQANLLVANICKVSKLVTAKVMAGYGARQITPAAEYMLIGMLNKLNDYTTGYKPTISAIALPECNAAELAKLTWNEHIWMIVKGVPASSADDDGMGALNIQTLLNKVQCPLLMIPENWAIKPMERMTYIADLRYCRLNIVGYLAEMAQPMKTKLAIAHLSAKGLPDIEEIYSQQLFKDNIASHIKNSTLIFNNIRERDIARAIDVIINGLHNDLLILVNHRFHFKQVLGDYLTSKLPAYVTVPLLIFPY